MKIGFFFGKWIRIVDNSSIEKDPQFLTVSKEDWEVIKTLDDKDIIIVATILDNFDAHIINYGL